MVSRKIKTPSPFEGEGVIIFQPKWTVPEIFGGKEMKLDKKDVEKLAEAMLPIRNKNAYDPQKIRELTRACDAQAGKIYFSYPAIGAFIGMSLVMVFQFILRQFSWPTFLYLASVGAVVGIMFSYQSVIRLKLAAQTALCVAKIEENTRRK